MTTTTRLRLVGVEEVSPGAIKRCAKPGFPPFAIYNVEGEYFVTEDNCTHGMASLSEGELDGDIVECPFHGGAFNVRTGEAVERPCIIPLKVFEVVVEGGVVCIDVACRSDRQTAAFHPMSSVGESDNEP